MKENSNKDNENYINEENYESIKNNIGVKEENIEDNENNKKGIENIIVEEIQKIKEVKIGQGENQTSNKEDEENSISNTDISKIKAFLIDEYEVSEECLEIN